MITDFKNKTAVLTGAASGFGLACARIAANLGMHVVLVDVQQDALDSASSEIAATAASHGGQVLSFQLDVAKADAVHAMAQAVLQKLGAPHFVFNNAGVGAGGLIWETSAKDWEWVLGVNLMGVVHGVHAFIPMMLEAAKQDPNYRAHMVNTASMAGLLNAPNMGVYNVSKHAVVSLTETLYHDLSLVTNQISASVLCPFFVPTGIAQSHRNKPSEMQEGNNKPTKSQLIGQAMSDKAVSSGKISAAVVAQKVFDAIAADQFYIYSHPQALAGVQTRLEDIMLARNPSDPFAGKPEIGASLKAALHD